MSDVLPDWSPIVTGVLLAGGLARRMGGGDKCLKPLAGKPLLRHAIDRLAPQTGALIINANGDPQRFSAFNLPVVADTIEGFAGPLAGILAGMEWARANAPKSRWVVSAATDTPFFPLDLVSRCIGAVGFKENVIALARSGDNLHPVFGLWPVALADDLKAWLSSGDNRKVLAWVGRHEMIEVIFPGFTVAGELLDPFFNANTPDDMDVAEAVIEEMAA